jgi:hypothetical protein
VSSSDAGAKVTISVNGAAHFSDNTGQQNLGQQLNVTLDNNAQAGIYVVSNDPAKIDISVELPYTLHSGTVFNHDHGKGQRLVLANSEKMVASASASATWTPIVPPAPEFGDFSVAKLVNANGRQLDPSLLYQFTVDGPNAFHDSFTFGPQGGTKDYTNKPTGVYTVTELADPQGRWTVDHQTLLVTVKANAKVEVSFTNTFSPVTPPVIPPTTQFGAVEALKGVDWAGTQPVAGIKFDLRLQAANGFDQVMQVRNLEKAIWTKVPVGPGTITELNTGKVWSVQISNGGNVVVKAGETTHVDVLNTHVPPKTVCPTEKFQVTAGFVSTCNEAGPVIKAVLWSNHTINPRTQDGQNYPDGKLDPFWDAGNVVMAVPMITGHSHDSIVKTLQEKARLINQPQEFYYKAKYVIEDDGQGHRQGYVETELTWSQLRDWFGGADRIIGADFGMNTFGGSECLWWIPVMGEAHLYPCPTGPQPEQPKKEQPVMNRCPDRVEAAPVKGAEGQSAVDAQAPNAEITLPDHPELLDHGHAYIKWIGEACEIPTNDIGQIRRDDMIQLSGHVFGIFSGWDKLVVGDKIVWHNLETGETLNFVVTASHAVAHGSEEYVYPEKLGDQLASFTCYKPKYNKTTHKWEVQTSWYVGAKLV